MKKNIAEYTAVVVSLVAIAGLIYQIYRNNALDSATNVRQWQKTVTYEILTRSEKPRTFESLYAEYLDEIENQAYMDKVPTKYRTKQDFRRVMYELEELGTVSHDGNDTYMLAPDESQALTLVLKRLLLMEEMNRIEDLAMDMLTKHDGEFSEGELFSEIQKEHGTTLTPFQFNAVIRSLWTRNIISILEPDKKINVNYNVDEESEKGGQQ